MNARYGFAIREDGRIMGVYGPYETTAIASRHRQEFLDKNKVKTWVAGEVGLYVSLVKEHKHGVTPVTKE